MIRLLVILLFVVPAMLLAQADQSNLEKVYFDVPDASGQLRGGIVFLPKSEARSLAAERTPAPSATLFRGGPSENRIDMVFVGDGYTTEEMDLFDVHVDEALSQLFSQEPFQTYQNFFNIHRVDVISNESGVDNDPTEGIERDTAMDMGFFCGGTERLLCVNVSKAYGFANNAPANDHVLAVANATKYGGAGYSSSDLATFSGGNVSSPEVAIHELGHSLGNLADEYFYNGDTYTGPEVAEANVSIYDSLTMAGLETKWADWLGTNDAAFDGLIDTFEGGRYNDFGIFRPTDNSKMRSLGRPFNLPSIEALLIEFYKFVAPIDEATPAGEVSGTAELALTQVPLVGSAYQVQWYLNDQLLEEIVGTRLDLAQLVLQTGDVVTVEVVDQSSWVRDEAARASYMTWQREWTVTQDAVSAAQWLQNGVTVLDLVAQVNLTTLF